jgi:hypothetical protein
LRVEEQIAKRLQESRTYEQIQTNLHVGPNRISRVKNAIDARLPPPPTLPRGQSTEMTRDLVQLVKICTTDDPLLGSKKLPGYILVTLGVSISQTAVTTIRKLLRFTYTSLRNRLVLSNKHIEKRMRFCQANVHGGIDWGAAMLCQMRRVSSFTMTIAAFGHSAGSILRKHSATNRSTRNPVWSEERLVSASARNWRSSRGR